MKKQLKHLKRTRARRYALGIGLIAGLTPVSATQAAERDVTAPPLMQIARLSLDRPHPIDSLQRVRLPPTLRGHEDKQTPLRRITPHKKPPSISLPEAWITSPSIIYRPWVWIPPSPKKRNVYPFALRPMPVYPGLMPQVYAFPELFFFSTPQLIFFVPI